MFIKLNSANVSSVATKFSNLLSTVFGAFSLAFVKIIFLGEDTFLGGNMAEEHRENIW
jgi:hypothetical protein